ncbi:hypothetical protein PAHA111176_13875 [Parendozoicomonas haliclonae]|uniref:Uncharacterized protein n=1 Tax=Parendozoicomonas haliclonae TaxID=1960125 RepID=A0A1X7AHT6_9GAMM|nr:hypothetical protein EHSB41UT_01632 [Parendozoicomonas haliclonae]
MHDFDVTIELTHQEPLMRFADFSRCSPPVLSGHFSFSSPDCCLIP